MTLFDILEDVQLPFNKEDVIWIVVLCFLISFVLGFALGANDVANSFGTSVGAKVLTLYQACFVAAIFETAGALLLGHKVSDTIRKGLFDPNLYEGYEELLMIGNLCALAGSCIWLFIATWFRIPVSATHSIVGASLGFHMVVFGDLGVNWRVVVLIILSWFASPAFSGAVSAIIFTVLNYSVIKVKNQLRNGLYSLPFWYFTVFFINLFSIFYDASDSFPKLDELWMTFAIACGAGALVVVCVIVFLIPLTRKRVIAARAAAAEEEAKKEETGTTEAGTQMTEVKEKSSKYEEIDKIADEPNGVLCPDPSEMNSDTDHKPPSYDKVQMDHVVVTAGAGESTVTKATTGMIKKGTAEWESVKDTPDVRILCSPMQVMSACFAAFTHGGNDVSNCIGPLVSLWIIFTTGNVSQEGLVPYWILLYGAAGISVGLFVLGRRVIQTVGSDLTPMTPSNGFAIELGSATTVLIASNLGIPISTTHCQVGSVCATGFVRTRRAVDWRLFSGIFSAWVITLPATIMISAALMGLLQHTVPNICIYYPPIPTTDFMPTTL